MLDPIARRTWVCAFLVALWPLFAQAGQSSHPLEPLDLSSPRATLQTFLEQGDEIYELLRVDYWGTPSREHVAAIEERNVSIGRMFDLTEVVPAARPEWVRDGLTYLYEVLSRIELPPLAEIPDASAYADIAVGDDKAGRKTVSWTIPHTEITLVRVAEGQRAGSFVFDSSTLARAREFYEKTRELPYRRDVPLKNYAEMRPYLSLKSWFISPRTIEGFPAWLKLSVYDQAVWKWIALLLLIGLTVAGILLIRSLALLAPTRYSGGEYWHRLSTPSPFC